MNLVLTESQALMVVEALEYAMLGDYPARHPVYQRIIDKIMKGRE